MPKNLYYYLLVLLIFPQILKAQEYNSIKSELGEIFEKYEIITINTEEIYNKVSSDRFSNIIDLQFDQPISVSLFPANLKADNYTLTLASKDHKSQTQEVILPFKGYVNNVNNSDVRMTFTKDMIYGYIEQNGEMQFIEPLWHLVNNADKNLFIIYNTHDVKNQGKTCGVNTMTKRAKELNTQNRVLVGDCYEIELAIASDFLMFQAFGTIAALEARNIGVMNNVQGNYDDEFADELQFNIVEQWISNCSSCDPWTSNTNPGPLLDDFTNWGPSGFSQAHDMGSLWTDRNFVGSTIGLAWVGTVCTTNRYHILENYTSSAWGLRVLTSHEMGHNFDATHDGSGTSFIMAPSVNNTNNWSNLSINDIENYYLGLSCLAFCPGAGQPPVAEFEADELLACRFAPVSFTDLSTNTPTSWSWSFENGTPATSTDENPTVTWATAGVYDVSLTVTNSTGTDSETKMNYITIEADPLPSWNYLVNQDLVSFFNTSLNGTSYYWDFGDGTSSTDFSPFHNYEDGTYVVILSATNSCGTQVFAQSITVVTLPQAAFTQDTTEGCAPFTVQYENLSSSNTTSFLWTFEGGNPATSTDENPLVIYENEGIFSVTLMAITGAGFDEEIQEDIIIITDIPQAGFTYTSNGQTYSFINQSINATSYVWEFGDNNFSTDENPDHTYSQDGTYQVLLTATNDCGSEDYILDITISTQTNANFSASATTGCTGVEIAFTDMSNNATSWDWTFEGGTPSISTEQNPIITYNSEGSFDVTLIATNDNGTDTLTFVDYISIDAYPDAGFDYTANNGVVNFNNSSTNSTSYFWNLLPEITSTEVDPTYTFEDGVYAIQLISTNDCGSDTIIQDIEIVTLPMSSFSVGSTEGCVPFEVQMQNNSSSNSTSYLWTFEGGEPSSSTEQTPTVTYNNAGTYNIELIVTNTEGSDTSSMTDVITVGDIPNSDFSFSINDLEVTFANLSTDADSYLWFLGDDDTSIDTNVIHDYASEGSYNILLISTNECGSDTLIQEINVSSLPTAQFESSGQNGCLPSVVYYTDVSNNATSWNWTFEGGEPSTSTDQNPVVTYNTAGTFDVTLVATNIAGSDTYSLTDYFTVFENPIANFEVTTNDLEATFTNVSEGANSYDWFFGNDSTSVEENPSIVYNEEGTYNVMLVATSIEGCVDTLITPVSVIGSSIVDFSSENNFYLYPNPNGGTFNIEFNGIYRGEINVDIYNIIGQSIGTFNLEKISSIGNIDIDLGQRVSGTYVVQIRMESNVFYEKVIVH